jgi:REP element-mobilizing transposase RayT
MPRPNRVYVPGGFYHVILRGNHRQAIFTGKHDRELWERYVADALSDCEARLHVYCWMTNHVHMVIEVGPVPLGRIVLRMATRYARWFQRTLATTGHLFERRHRAYPVTTDSYLLALARYIHRNPVRGGLARTVDEYEWSSHHAYVGRRERTWLTTDRVLEIFSADRARARSAYREFMLVEDDEPPVDDVAGPGSAVAGPTDRSARARRRPAAAGTLEQLVERVATEHGVSADALVTTIRDSYLSRVRAEIAWQAVRSGVATTGEVARRFGCSTAAISRAVARCRERGRVLPVKPPDER